MKRRAFLATGGIALSAVLGGCQGEASTPASGGSPTDSPGPETDTPKPETDTPGSDTPEPDTDTPGTSPDGIDIESIIVRKAVTYESIMGSGGVLAAEGKQYVVAAVRSNRELSASAFSFVTDDDSWQPGLPDTLGAENVSVAGIEGGAVGGHHATDKSYLAFVVPSPLSASNPRIRFEEDDLEWSLPAAETERLAAPAPRFELDELSVPDEITQGDTMEVSLTVTNVSETDGRFLAAVYWPTKRIADDDESHLVERDVGAGESVTATLSIDTRYTTDESEVVTLAVDGYVSAERNVSVQRSETSS